MFDVECIVGCGVLMKLRTPSRSSEGCIAALRIGFVQDQVTRKACGVLETKTWMAGSAYPVTRLMWHGDSSLAEFICTA